MFCTSAFCTVAFNRHCGLIAMDIFEAAERYPRRTIDHEEEEAAQATCLSAAEPLPVIWNQTLRKALFPQGIIVNTMVRVVRFSKVQDCGCTPDFASAQVVATHRAGCALLNHMAPQKQVLGTVLLPEQCMKGNRALPDGAPSTADRHCIIYVVPPLPTVPSGSHPSLLVSCQWQVSPERSNAVCRALLGEVCPERVVVLGSLPAEQYRGPGDVSQEPLLFSLCTDKMMQGQSSSSEQPPALPTGNAVGGLPAALLQYCQVRGMQAVLLVSINGPSALQPLSLTPIANALISLLPEGWNPPTAVPQARAELIHGTLTAQTHL